MEINTTKFRRISAYESAKRSLGQLKTKHERIIAARVSEIERLIKYFKNLTIGDDESFNDFYSKLNDIVCTLFNLGTHLTLKS